MDSSFEVRRRGNRSAQPAVALAVVAGLGLAVLFCALLATPRTAAAVAFEVTPYGGYAFWDKTLDAKDAVHFGGKLGAYFGRLGIEGNFGYSPLKAESDETQKAKLMNYGGDLVFRFVKEGNVVPYILAGGGGTRIKLGTGGSVTNYSLDGGAGLLFKLSPRFGVRVEGRDLMVHNSDALEGEKKFTHNIIATGGLSFIFGGEKDSDKDGVKDSKDQCPDTPLGCVVNADGCPVDSDKDGVCDGIDQCANTPQGCKVDDKGCPNDGDKDGVCDGVDQCPDTPAGVKVDEKGCPLDSDGDGVTDDKDQCPNTPAGVKVDDKGCPLDTDGDGVTDDKDLCPNTPPGVKVDKDGCPIEITEKEKEMLDKGSITVRNIHFETAKWDITDEAAPVLDELGKIFIQWPQLKIEIGGHCDARGSDAYNQKLSEQRANSVRDWLVAHYPQLDPNSFTAMGYGESKPVATNKTQTGMALNRRVEFKVLNTEELEKVKERRRMLQQGE